MAQDEPEWYNGDNDANEAEEEGELFEFGEECLDRLALALGGSGLLPLAQAALPQLLQSSDWRQRHAALICLAQTAEGCVKSMLKQLAPWVDLCLMVRHYFIINHETLGPKAGQICILDNINLCCRSCSSNLSLDLGP